MNRGRIAVTLVVIFESILCFWTSDALLLLKQDPVVSKYTQEYLVAYLPALILYSFGDLQRRVFSSCRKTYLPMVSFFTAVSLHPLWCKLLVVDQNLGFTGIAFAGIFTNCISLGLMVALQRVDGQLNMTRVRPDHRSFAGPGQYLLVGMPFVIT